MFLPLVALGDGLAIAYTAFNVYTNRKIPTVIYIGNTVFTAGMLGLPAWQAYLGRFGWVQLLEITALAFLWTVARTGRYVLLWNEKTRSLFTSFGYTKVGYTIHLVFKNALIRFLWDLVLFTVIASAVFWAELVLYYHFYDGIFPILWSIAIVGVVEGIVEMLKVK